MTKEEQIAQINKMNSGTLMEALEMECIDFSEGLIKIKMPVTDKSRQQLGLLHGGASAALIESVGSIGSATVLDLEKHIPLGLTINANHISGARDGFVIATGKLVHRGAKTHVWQVDIHHESTEKLICTGRLTLMIMPRK